MEEGHGGGWRGGHGIETASVGKHSVVSIMRLQTGDQTGPQVRPNPGLSWGGKEEAVPREHDEPFCLSMVLGCIPLVPKQFTCRSTVLFIYTHFNWLAKGFGQGSFCKFHDLHLLLLLVCVFEPEEKPGGRHDHSSC